MNRSPKPPSRLVVGAVIATLSALAGCATTPPQQLRPGLRLPQEMSVPANAEDDLPAEGRRALEQRETPKNSYSSSATAGTGEATAPRFGTAPVKINVQELTVPAFINEVFGNQLGLNIAVDNSVATLEELVTLNTAASQRPAELYATASGVLADYGVSTEFDGDVVRFKVVTSGVSPAPPLVVSGRALPSVPVSHRPVFQLVELEVVRASDAQRWLSTVFGAELSVRDEASRNALLISGKPMQVRQALDALKVFDRPMMRGRVSTRLEPAVMSAEQLADRLVEVMTAQGYGISKSVNSPSSVVVLPIPAVNALLVFASSPQTLEYTVSWARELDRVSPNASGNSMFYYQVRNTKAADIAGVLSGGVSEGITAAGQAPAAAGAPTAAVGRSGARIVVDEPRNALIFQGDAAEWGTTLGLIRQMDRAPRQVMLEVTIAEVSLDGTSSSGVQWFAKNGFGRFDGEIVSGGSGSSDGGGDDDDDGGGGGSGLTYLLDVAGQNRLTLNALASDSRVSVLSTPRLLVKSGGEANIDIGTEVPTVTAQTTSNQQSGGNTALLQSIQYRKTGIILKVSPTVYSDDRVDLEIEQEVSEALPLTTGSPGGSPSIFNRSLSTSLTLRDGGSVVMAGLISSRQTESDSGIPFLKDIPALGRLFGTQSNGNNRTELVLMIVPYIIDSDDRSTQISSAILDSFELLEAEDVGSDVP